MEDLILVRSQIKREIATCKGNIERCKQDIIKYNNNYAKERCLQESAKLEAYERTMKYLNQHIEYLEKGE